LGSPPDSAGFLATQLCRCSCPGAATFGWKPGCHSSGTLSAHQTRSIGSPCPEKQRQALAPQRHNDRTVTSVHRTTQSSEAKSSPLPKSTTTHPWRRSYKTMKTPKPTHCATLSLDDIVTGGLTD